MSMDFENYHILSSRFETPKTPWKQAFSVLGGGGGGARPPNVPTKKMYLSCASERLRNMYFQDSKYKHYKLRKVYEYASERSEQA